MRWFHSSAEATNENILESNKTQAVLRAPASVQNTGSGSAATRPSLNATDGRRWCANPAPRGAWVDPAMT
ncbi:hypothetical protein BJI47_21450 [Rhodococcus sp. 1168]|nr:hypothetical protein BJI47_21450 [Rhodococcus sp. 1168]